MDPNSFPPQNYSEQKKENTNFFEIWRQIKSYLFEIFKFLWLIIGLAALGKKGANHVHDILKDELSNIMEQICTKDIKELKSENVMFGNDFNIQNFSK